VVAFAPRCFMDRWKATALVLFGAMFGMVCGLACSNGTGGSVAHADLVEPLLLQGGYRIARLDGSTPPSERRSLVERFQEGGIDVFLLSLKAGGVGLNLTAASEVVLLDPWWNPAVEDQAADRAHRIGQTEAVTIYRLVAGGLE